MIQREYYLTREDGVVLWRTWSDTGHYIRRDGVLYAEAVDPEDCGRVYEETGERVEEQPDTLTDN